MNAAKAIKSPEYVKKQSRLRVILKRLFRNKAAIVCACVLVVVLLAALLAPYITPYSYDEMNLTAKNQGPSLAHLFGTDDLGRDIFSRVIYGGRYSLTISIIAVICALILGMVFGSIAGFLAALLIML